MAIAHDHPDFKKSPTNLGVRLFRCAPTGDTHCTEIESGRVIRSRFCGGRVIRYTQRGWGADRLAGFGVGATLSVAEARNEPLSALKYTEERNL
jgi:hypothetical protein